MSATQVKAKVMGYLPNDVPPLGQLVLLGFQHVLTMFPATVLVALLVGFHVSTVLMASGMATIVALIGSRLATGKFIPLYYGSSFSYIAATLAITHANFGEPAPDELISAAQAGIVATGLVNIATGLAIRWAGGKSAIDKILPPVVTGSVATVIGFGLGKAALDMAGGTCCGTSGSGPWWFVAITTLVATILFSVYLQGRGFIGMIPILLGAIVGYIVAAIVGAIMPDSGVAPNYAAITQSPLLTAPHITLPNFTHPMATTAIISIAVMAIATIPESTAHLYQISLYVDHLAEELGRPRLWLNRYIGINLVLDGLGDMVNGLLGGVAGTNYGENNSLMAITRNYSGPALLAAGAIAILLSFSGTLAGIVNSVPTAVSGGLAIYLFGVIGLQGIALMMSERVNLFDPQQLAIGAVIMIIGIGGNIGFPDGFIPVPILRSIFPNGLPAIATGAVAGILLNLLFMVVPAPEARPAVTAPTPEV
ncbi:MAG: solute carrier family 23 protein [Anaerolineae bacterium]